MGKDRSWMYGGSTTSDEFLNGLAEFSNLALENQAKTGADGFYCPCAKCANVGWVNSIYIVREHVIRNGFRPQYQVWVWHGEEGVYEGNRTLTDGHEQECMIQVHEEDCNIENEFSNDDCEDDADEKSNDDEGDYLEEMMEGVEDDLGKHSRVFQSLNEASQKPLYAGCEKFTKLSAVLTLYNIKLRFGFSDTGFTALLEELSEMFPEGNELPKSNYYAKKLMCPFGLEYKKIHACPNDCVLFQNEYENLDKCPKCGESRYKRQGRAGDKKGPPAKVLWYLPIIPRLKRMFSLKKDAKNLRWHADGRKKDGLLKHPADSPEWKNIDRLHKTFASDDRNLRLGLCTDGMNPFGSLSTKHSTWPVLLTIYNLPPWLCMKRKYIMLSLLISGPRQPGNDICVYLQPLVDDLIKLWGEGVRVFDAYKNEMFTLRAMLFCTINDFPAYGNLSGYKTKGKKACPICMDDMNEVYIKEWSKHVYMPHRRYLPPNHPFRKKKKAFDGCVEERRMRAPLTGSEVYDQVKDVDTNFGKGENVIHHNNEEKLRLWKKKSIFWKLPYWKDLQVRHCLDVMHIEKNVCDSLLGTLMNIPNKTKDDKRTRNYLKRIGLRQELWPQERVLKRKRKECIESEGIESEGKGAKKGKAKLKGKGKGKGMRKGKTKDKVEERAKNGSFLPPACYTMSREEKRAFCECLYHIKVPTGYCSNMKRFVSLSGDLALGSMKSHDCHVMMQVFIPIAIRSILPKHVRVAITELCSFFNIICSKVLDPDKLDLLQADVVKTLCKFEMFFPPSFFDIMPHLIVHLVREIKLCGPVFLRWCYPFEREMHSLQGKVRNLAQPEGSMIQGTVTEEVGNFISEYLRTAEPIGLPTSRHDGRLEGKGTSGSKLITPSRDRLLKAHLFVLHHVIEVHPYLDEHMNELRSQYPTKGSDALMQLHNKTFVDWFHNRIMNGLDDTVSSTIKWLAYGPREGVNTYDGYDVNGYTFWTERHDNRSSSVQNSGVSVFASSTMYANEKDFYYGRIQEIWELDYCDFKVGLFSCKWVENNRRCIKKDETCGFTLVDLGRMREGEEPFILATQVKQVFYVTDPANKKWSIVLQGKRSILGIGDVDNEEEYDAFEDVPAFTCPSTNVANDGDEDISYMRVDHMEGIVE